jgi:hypothetical protein
MDGTASVGGGISNYGEMSIANSTVSENVLGSEGNSGAGIVNYGRLSLVSSTISQNQSDFGEEAIESGFPQPSDPEPRVEIAGTVIDGASMRKVRR